MKLTKRAVDAMKYDPGDGKAYGKSHSMRRDVRWDDDIPGFGVRITPAGKKSFVLSYYVNGRKRLMTIARYGVKTLDEARKAAKKFLANLDSTDPLEERQKTRQGETVKDLCDAYLERHAKLRKKSWSDDERRINNRIIPLWGNLRADSIKRKDVAALHTRIGKSSPYEANRIIRLLSKMFSLARQWGFVPENHINPARDIELFSEKKRERWINPVELPKLAQAIDEDENIHARNALWLYLLTGARKSELLKARWEDVDWAGKELKIPDTKAGRVHHLPLSDAAMAVLRQIPRLEGNPYIIPGQKEGTHLVNIDKPWRRVRNRATVKLWADHEDPNIAGLVTTLFEKLEREPTVKEIREAAKFDLPTGVTDARLHDLRRTVGSWLAQAGNSLHLIGKVLNHSNTSTTAIYARFSQDQVRQALETHGKQIMGVAKASGKVVKLREAK